MHRPWLLVGAGVLAVAVAVVLGVRGRAEDRPAPVERVLADLRAARPSAAPQDEWAGLVEAVRAAVAAAGVAGLTPHQAGIVQRSL